MVSSPMTTGCRLLKFFSREERLAGGLIRFRRAGFLVVEERNIASPPRRCRLFLVLAKQCIKVIVAKNDGPVANGLKEILMFLNVMNVAKFVENR